MTSPGPMGISSPSSGLTVICPERQNPVWWTWQESVPAIGLTSLDQRQPGSKTPRPRVKSPKVTTSMWPWSWNGRRSCGASMFCLSDMSFSSVLVGPAFRIASLRWSDRHLGADVLVAGEDVAGVVLGLDLCQSLVLLCAEGRLDALVTLVADEVEVDAAGREGGVRLPVVAHPGDVGRVVGSVVPGREGMTHPPRRALAQRCGVSVDARQRAAPREQQVLGHRRRTACARVEEHVESVVGEGVVVVGAPVLPEPRRVVDHRLQFRVG